MVLASLGGSHFPSAPALTRILALRVWILLGLCLHSPSSHFLHFPFSTAHMVDFLSVFSVKILIFSGMLYCDVFQSLRGNPG